MESNEPRKDRRDMTFIELAASYSAEEWTRITRIYGAILGAAAAAVICFLQELLQNYAFAISVIMVLLVPRLIENTSQREVKEGKTAMLIAFIAVMAVYSLIYFLILN